MKGSQDQERSLPSGTPESEEDRQAFESAESRRRFRHGALSIAITAGVIALVLLLNVLVFALFQSQLWYVDMTGEVYQEKNPEYLGLYSLTDACKDLLSRTFAGLREQYGKESEVEILFCDDPDVLVSNSAQRMIYYTALNLQKAFPKNIKVKCVDVYHNASAVQKYKTNSVSTIYPTQVIISSGSEFRVMSIRAFFVYSDNNSTEPWAYNGEKYFSSSIIAVTKAEAPICCVTNNHGELPVSESFWNLLGNAGYAVQYLDLEHEEIPENCRLILTYGPTEDFKSRFDGTDGVSEIEKLDKFLDKAYSYAIFTNADTPVLKNLEEYLSEWGIVLDRTSDNSGSTYNYRIQNPVQTLSADGFTFVGEYATQGTGSGITNDMRSAGNPAKVVFRNASSFSYDRTYQTRYITPEDDDTLTEPYAYASRSSNGVSRTISNIFTAGETSLAWVDDGNGDDPENGNMSQPDDVRNYPLMVLTTESRNEQETNYTSVSHVAYVMACASTDFASDTLLQSEVYGNADILLAALRAMGKEVVGVNLAWKPFNKTDVKDGVINAGGARTVTVVMTVIPLVAAAVTGTIIVLRRRIH